MTENFLYMGWWKSDPVTKVNLTLSLSIFFIKRNYTDFYVLLLLNIAKDQHYFLFVNLMYSKHAKCRWFIFISVCCASWIIPKINIILFIRQCTLYLLNAFIYTCTNIHICTIHFCVLLKLVMPKINVTFSMYSASSLKAGRTFVKIISFASSSSFSLKIFQISSFFFILVPLIVLFLSYQK